MMRGRYSPEEDKYIIDNWDKLSVTRISIDLDRDYKALSEHAHKYLNLPSKRLSNFKSKRERMRRLAKSDDLSTKEYAKIACNCKNSLLYIEEK